MSQWEWFQAVEVSLVWQPAVILAIVTLWHLNFKSIK